MSSEMIYVNKGTFGKVYLKNNTIIKKVKLVKQNDDDETIVFSSIREIAFLKVFKHPNIIELYKQKIVNNEVELYMENGGQTLSNWMRTTEISKRAKHIPYIAYQLLKVLLFLEVNGIVHGDIKPENIVMNSEKVVKLIDWGGCIFRPAKDSISLCSTACFLCPEQRDYYTRKPETGTFNDIFSFGLTILSVFFNKYPTDYIKIDNTKKCINVLKVFDKELEELCEFEDMNFVKTIINCLRIDSKQRPSASSLIMKSCFEKFREKDSDKLEYKPIEMNFTFMTETKKAKKILNYVKEIFDILTDVKATKYIIYANMICNKLFNDKSVREFINSNNDYKKFFPHFCIDLCIILFDDEKDSDLYDFDLYDEYFEVRIEMMENILPLIDFDIYRKI